MTQQLDYHVGLMRGYLLAQNAPTQILHALDILLSDYRSKAGPVIGDEPKAIERDSFKESKKIDTFAEPVQDLNISPVVNGTEKKKKFFWDKEDDRILEEMLGQGKFPKEISRVLERTPASISTRMAVRGLTRAKAAA